MNYREALEYIHSLGNFSKPASTDRITKLLDCLGNPQNKFHSIHIAGTNGKGSVSAMLSKVFVDLGKKTGLFISPFIINFRERIQINGDFISEQDIVKYSERVRSAKVDVTEFEFITAVAFLYFYEKNCDIAIIETGLGGRFDATNTLENPDAVVITKIGLDHTVILGETIEKIANEKCGIIRKSPVIASCNQLQTVYDVIKGYSDKLIVPEKSKLKIIKSDDTGNVFLYNNRKYETSLAGEFQIENTLTVIETLNNCGFSVSYSIVYEALKNVYFPARNEIISKKPLVVLDGAHNPDGAEALAHFMRRYSGKITAIIGVMKDKNYREVLEKTLIYCKNSVAVTVEGMSRSLSAKALCKTANDFCKCITAQNYNAAIKESVKLSEGGPIFVFGSLYLASGIREKIKKFYKNIN